MAGFFSREWRSGSQRPSTSPSLTLHKIKGKSDQNRIEKLTNIGTINTLRKILKDQKACCGKEEVVSKTLQLREPIQRFPITRLALPPLRALHIFYCLSHKVEVGAYRRPHRVKRKSETVVESRAINNYTFGGRLIHGGIRLGDYEGVPNRQELGIVISHGYETSTSGLRTPGVEECSQLDHKGVPVSKRGIV
ncbi:hypothetical protein Cgig2_021256 [Carnegiea gigantea]|uniref:Uncharacterized protein n=1 Tax=Carnegiea gigantea TaxID=171969 RepID=A0A9Q1Q9F3_9CARY|nr:hypothetical protein Cgig2_021256 [Carnegiea gigantea]